MRLSKFVVYKENDQYSFRLKAKNGQLLCSGQFFKNKESVLNVIELIKKEANLSVVIEEEY